MKNQGVIIITGGGRGLGSSIAQIAHSLGSPVALVGRSKASLQSTKAALETATKKGQKITIHSVDLTNEKAVEREFKLIKKEHGPPRALINNAATWMGISNAEELSTREIKKSFELNFFSAVHATTSLLKITGTKPKNDLAIVNIGATASLDAWMEVLPFSLAKGALRDYSRALARELGPKGIHVAHLVIDGMLDNERTRKLNKSLKDDRFIRSTSVAESILHVINQERSCWTMEWDVRPFNESW